MNTEKFEEMVNNQIELCKKTLLKKAKEYATEDRLHNFKVAAELQEISPEQALAGMMAKHTVSIYDMCNSPNPIDYPIELWDEKITDSINYLLLLAAVIRESDCSEAIF